MISFCAVKVSTSTAPGPAAASDGFASAPLSPPLPAASVAVSATEAVEAVSPGCASLSSASLPVTFSIGRLVDRCVELFADAFEQIGQIIVAQVVEDIAEAGFVVFAGCRFHIEHIGRFIGGVRCFDDVGISV